MNATERANRVKLKMVERYAAMRVTDLIEPVVTDRWEIERRVITEDEGKLSSMRAMLSGSRGRHVPPGTYTGLWRRGEGNRRSLVMSDTPDELLDHSAVYEEAHGRVLINGLGLGCVLRGVLSRPEVTHVDVVEVDEDLIRLIGPYYEDPRLVIHHGDAFTYTWPTGTRWNVVWNDVWDTINPSNLSDEEDARPGTYARLHRRYGRRSDWMGSWCFELLRYENERQNRYLMYG